MVHISVLPKEVPEYLDPKIDGDYIDGTVGEGGHAKSILEKIGPRGRLLGIDASQRVLAETEKNLESFSGRITLVQGNFSDMGRLVREAGWQKVDGILLDLGISLWHLGRSGRGFSFGQDEPLIMKFGEDDGGLTAEKIVNEWPEEKLRDIFRTYGEERYSRKLARLIVESRKEGRIRTTKQLADLIYEHYPKKYSLKIHPATKIFQALRIAVNNELDSLKKVLPEAVGLLKPGGRLVIISFHSLEDRIVKRFFQAEARDCICPPSVPVCVCRHRASLKILTKKPAMAGAEEVSRNPGSRSAKLRAAEKLSDNREV